MAGKETQGQAFPQSRESLQRKFKITFMSVSVNYPGSKREERRDHSYSYWLIFLSPLFPERPRMSSNEIMYLCGCVNMQNKTKVTI